MARAADPTPAPEPASLRFLPNRPLVLIGAAAVVLLMLGGAAGWFFFLRVRGPARAAASVSHEPQQVWKAGTVVVNVAGTGGRRYLRTTIELGVTPKSAKHVEEQRAPLIDAAIGVLGTEPLERLLDPAHREELRAQLKDRLNEALGGPSVTHVFLTEFVVQ